MTEEWTFVTHSKRSSKPGRRRRHISGVNGGSGLYRNADDDDDDGMKRFFDNSINPNPQTTFHQQPKTEAEQMEDRERIRDAILECISALERVFTSNTSFSFRLIAALREVTTSSSSDNKDEEENDNGFNIREIVAYGIGNFASTSFSAPMLQLACVLFLRRCAADVTFVDANDVNSSSDDIQNIFKSEQDRVPIYYYEPCILPVERDLLQTVFHVFVLESNDYGKLNVHSMRQDNHIPGATTRTGSGEKVSKTLFYMPHCPMRLYCNVLWSHWGCLDSTVIFGNSFHSYDERILSSERRNDPTNGLLRVIPCTNEMSINLQSNRRGDELYFDDALNYLETAFNDCNIISFTGDERPDRPDEYFASQDPENGELI